MSRRIAVLISGRGSNLQAIVGAERAGRLGGTVAVAISNKAEAAGLAFARQAGIECLHLDPRSYADPRGSVDRDAYDRAIVDALHTRSIDLVCLAGFMRVVGAPLLSSFVNRVLNIHPSLLPSFPGLQAQRQALEHGVRVTGATVHLVTDHLDGCPIVAQAVVPVIDSDTVETLSERILVEEHRIYPDAIRLVLDGRWELVGRRFVRLPEESAPRPPAGS